MRVRERMKYLNKKTDQRKIKTHKNDVIDSINSACMRMINKENEDSSRSEELGIRKNRSEELRIRI